jgi:hypothetical protein
MSTRVVPNPNYLPTSTRRWAISALVLSIITLLMTTPALFQIRKEAPLYGNKEALHLILMFAGILTAVAFLVGSIALLKGGEWARESLAYTSAVAIVLTVLGAAMLVSLVQDPDYSSAMLAAMGKSSTPGAADMAQKMIPTIIAATFWAGMVTSVIQIVYCALLYRHMSADPADHSE